MHCIPHSIVLFTVYIGNLEGSSDNEILEAVIRRGESGLHSILNVCCQGAVLHCIASLLELARWSRDWRSIVIVYPSNITFTLRHSTASPTDKRHINWRRKPSLEWNISDLPSLAPVVTGNSCILQPENRRIPRIPTESMGPRRKPFP